VKFTAKILKQLLITAWLAALSTIATRSAQDSIATKHLYLTCLELHSYSVTQVSPFASSSKFRSPAKA
jgi:hypothetical protein